MRESYAGRYGDLSFIELSHEVVKWIGVPAAPRFV